MTTTYTANDGRKIKVTPKYNIFAKHTDLNITGFKIGEANGSRSGLQTSSHDTVAPNSSWPRLAELYYGQEIAEQIQADYKAGKLEA